MRRPLLFIAGFALLFTTAANADVDKVYHPYVEQDTYELESRLISLLDRELAASFSVYRFGFGKDISEDLFVELYLIGAKESDQKIELEAYEVEALYQLTEQGEYWLDAALLVEVERETDSENWEGNFALILEKEFGRWSAALNIHNQNQIGNDQKRDWQRSQAFQMRYRYSSQIEPGFEIYSDQNNFFVGPVILGQVNLDSSKLNWEVGIVKEFNHSGTDNVLRALLEYEF